MDLRELLGTRQYVRYVNYRARQYNALSVRAKNAEANYLGVLLRAQPVIDDITRNLRARIAPPSVRQVPQFQYLGTRPPPGGSQASVQYKRNVSPGFVGVLQVVPPPIYSHSRPGHIERRPAPSYYRVTQVTERSPGLSEAEAQRLIAERLASYEGLAGYRAARAARNEAQGRLAGFRILG